MASRWYGCATTDPASPTASPRACSSASRAATTLLGRPGRLLPLDGARRLRRDVEGDAIDARDLVYEAAGHALQDLVGKPRPVGGHGVLAGDGAHDDRIRVGALVAHHPHAADHRQHG